MFFTLVCDVIVTNWAQKSRHWSQFMMENQVWQTSSFWKNTKTVEKEILAVEMRQKMRHKETSKKCVKCALVFPLYYSKWNLA